MTKIMDFSSSQNTVRITQISITYASYRNFNFFVYHLGKEKSFEQGKCFHLAEFPAVF